ncbi:MAG: glycosyltransferase [Aridibacter famidurans]|nr:glycosyltransferase [Aridibacter famidurans]
MKVLYHLDSLDRGGTETIVLDVCRSAERNGFAAILFASGEGDLKEDLEGSGIDHRFCRRRLPIDPFLALQIRRTLVREKIDAVHGFQAVEVIHLWLAALGTGVPVIYSHGGFTSGWKNRIGARIAARLAERNIAVSRSLLDYLATDLKISGAGGFEVIWNAIDERRLESDGRSIREELEIGDNVPLMAMTANFRGDGTKDQLTVCRALDHVRRNGGRFGFLFIGSNTGPGEREYLACREFCSSHGLEDDVFFLGSRDDVGSILDHVDLFVYSSRMEGLSIAVAEAMLKGVPMIVSGIDPLLEVTRAGELAGVFEVGDAEGLADQIETYLGDEALRSDQGRKLRAYAIEHFTIGAHLEKLKALYREVLGSVPPGPADRSV